MSADNLEALKEEAKMLDVDTLSVISVFFPNCPPRSALPYPSGF